MPTLPGSPHLDYRGAQLFVEDCALSGLAECFGTPLYVYSRTAMLAALAAYKQALAGRAHMIFYAVKANSSLAVLQVFAQAGCGFDIVSGGELERVIAAGADPGKVLFSGVGKTRSEMRRALEAGVRCFNVESEAELDVLSQVAMQSAAIANVSLRVNPDVDAKTHPYISTGLKGNKFGIAHDQALSAYLRAASLPGIQVKGIACHIGSQITEIAPYLDALELVLELVEAVEAQGLKIGSIDMGGGLAIMYSDENVPCAQSLVEALLARIDARGHGQRQLLLEPGRSLVGNAGVLVGEVLYQKPSANKTFCVVDCAMNDLIRPSMYDAWMTIASCTLRDDEPAFNCDVVGPICESGDWLGRDRRLALRAGDFVAVLSAGAYGMSMASNYNSRGRAAEVMVSGDQAWLIRDRELPQALFKGEHLLPST